MPLISSAEYGRKLLLRLRGVCCVCACVAYSCLCIFLPLFRIWSVGFPSSNSSIHTCTLTHSHTNTCTHARMHTTQALELLRHQRKIRDGTRATPPSLFQVCGCVRVYVWVASPSVRYKCCLYHQRYTHTRMHTLESRISTIHHAHLHTPSTT